LLSEGLFASNVGAWTWWGGLSYDRSAKFAKKAFFAENVKRSETEARLALAAGVRGVRTAMWDWDSKSFNH